MARFYEKIAESSIRWYDGLSDRERRLLSVLSIILLVLLVTSTVYLGITKLGNRRAELAKNKQQLTLITDLEGQYLKAKEKTEKARMTVLRNNVSLLTFIQGVTNRLGLSVKELTEQKRPLPKSDIVEVSVKLNLSKLSIDKVTALIEAIETSEMGQLIKVTKLKINKRFDEPDLLDLQMTVSTWKTA